MWPILVCSVVMHYILIWWWCQAIPRIRALVCGRDNSDCTIWVISGQNIHGYWISGDGSVGDNHGCGVYGDGAILTTLAMKTLALTRRAVLTTIKTSLTILAMKHLREQCWQQLRPWHWGWIVTLGPLVTRFHQGQGPFMLEMAFVMMMMIVDDVMFEACVHRQHTVVALKIAFLVRNHIYGDSIM